MINTPKVMVSNTIWRKTRQFIPPDEIEVVDIIGHDGQVTYILKHEEKTYTVLQSGGSYVMGNPLGEKL